jgi:hypothetical protein
MTPAAIRNVAREYLSDIRELLGIILADASAGGRDIY